MPSVAIEDSNADDGCSVVAQSWWQQGGLRQNPLQRLCDEGEIGHKADGRKTTVNPWIRNPPHKYVWFGAHLDAQQRTASTEMTGLHVREAFGECVVNGLRERLAGADDIAALTSNREEAADRSEIRPSRVLHAYPLLQARKTIRAVTAGR